MMYIPITKEEEGRSAGEGGEGTIDSEGREGEGNYITVGFVS